MNRVLRCFLAFALVASVSVARSSSAATVSFMGAFTGGGATPGDTSSPLLGSIPIPNSPQPYSVLLNFLDDTSSTPGAITGGNFFVNGLTFGINGGTITVQDVGSSDSAFLAINVVGPPLGNLSVLISGGAAISNNAINAANLNALLANSGAGSSVAATFNNQGSYTGNVVAIPEPSSSLWFVGCLALSTLRRRRSVR